MAQTLTEWLQQNRLMVVEVDPTAQRLRVRSADERCTELACGGATWVVSDEGASQDLTTLYPGDTIKVEATAEGAGRITVVRRAWEDIASPEL
jgi:hypothetical protein